MLYVVPLFDIVHQLLDYFLLIHTVRGCLATYCLVFVYRLTLLRRPACKVPLSNILFLVEYTFYFYPSVVKGLFTGTQLFVVLKFPENPTEDELQHPINDDARQCQSQSGPNQFVLGHLLDFMHMLMKNPIIIITIIVIIIMLSIRVTSGFFDGPGRFEQLFCVLLDVEICSAVLCDTRKYV